MNLSLVMAADGRFAMPLAVALRSLVEANDTHWPIDVYVLCSEFPEHLKSQVVRSLPVGSVEIIWIAAELTVFEGLSSFNGLSKITYARLLIPVVLPERVSRVLYLDSDILVLRNLGDLWRTDLDGAVVGAVLDGMDAVIKNGRAKEENLPAVREYFNSGVLLIDVNRWRVEQVSETALEYLATHKHCRFPDQDALNVVCDRRIKVLDGRWNFQAHYKTALDMIDPEQRPCIVHFVTDVKPWRSEMLSVNAQFYDEVRDRTYFARTSRERLLDTMKREWSRTKDLLKGLAVGLKMRE